MILIGQVHESDLTDSFSNLTKFLNQFKDTDLVTVVLHLQLEKFKLGLHDVFGKI